MQGHARTTAREQHRDSRQKRRGGRALRGGRDRSPRAQRGGNEGAGRGMRRATRSTRRNRAERNCAECEGKSPKCPSARPSVSRGFGSSAAHYPPHGRSMLQHANEGERSEPEEEGTAQGLAHGRRPPRQGRAETDKTKHAHSLCCYVRACVGVREGIFLKTFVLGGFWSFRLEIGRRYYCTAFCPRDSAM